MVEAIGSQVTRFTLGDKVVTLFNQDHTDTVCRHHWSGGSKDGCLRQYGVFDEDGLVAVPKNLNFEDAAMLSCAA